MSLHITIKSATAAALVLLIACTPKAQHEQAAALPSVSVAPVIHQQLTELDEFTGRLQAPQSVELRPQVSGTIAEVSFEEGALVSAGDLLFQIDERPFKAEVNRLQAQLNSARSRLSQAKSEHLRAKSLLQRKAISDELAEARLAQYQQAAASLAAVGAALELAQVNLSYTKVSSPIDGRVSNAIVTKGNYINAGQSILTRIVSTKKVYAYFDADEQTYLNYAQLAREGSRPSSRQTPTPVYMALANDTDYPHEGYIDFVDNQVDPNTGTIRGRAVFDNREGLFIPGLFARIQLVGSATYHGILIDNKAIGTDLNNKFVLVIDDDNTVQYRPVVLGEKLAGLRIVKSGLEATDKIVVNGLQRVRPGAKVNPELVDMASAKTLAKIEAMQARIKHVSTDNGYVSRAVDATPVGKGG